MCRCGSSPWAARAGQDTAQDRGQDRAQDRTGWAVAAVMAHEDVAYYRGQYKERLLPLLR